MFSFLGGFRFSSGFWDSFEFLSQSKPRKLKRRKKAEKERLAATSADSAPIDTDRAAGKDVISGEANVSMPAQAPVPLAVHSTELPPAPLADGSQSYEGSHAPSYAPAADQFQSKAFIGWS